MNVSFSPTVVLALCLGLIALALLVLGMDRVLAMLRQRRDRAKLDDVIANARVEPRLHASAQEPDPRADPTDASHSEKLVESIASLGSQVSASRFGELALAEEDIRLLAQCGFRDLRSRYIFLASRLLVPVGLVLTLIFFWQLPFSDKRFWLAVFAAFSVGFLLPKWVLGSIARKRLRRVESELPWMVDLLQLLQGVGLSMDQSLHIIAKDFRGTLAVLGKEVEISNQQFSAGRSREQSLNRLGSLYHDEELKNFVNLILQIDRFGGSVQEPMKRFGDRLQEQRRTKTKERIGQLTVKMTAVMVLFMLPSLLIVTAGPGFLAIIRALSRMGGGS